MWCTSSFFFLICLCQSHLQGQLESIVGKGKNLCPSPQSTPNTHEDYPFNFHFALVSGVSLSFQFITKIGNYGWGLPLAVIPSYEIVSTGFYSLDLLLEQSFSATLSSYTEDTSHSWPPKKFPPQINSQFSPLPWFIYSINTESSCDSFCL